MKWADGVFPLAVVLPSVGSVLFICFCLLSLLFTGNVECFSITEAVDLLFAVSYFDFIDERCVR